MKISTYVKTAASVALLVTASSTMAFGFPNPPGHEGEGNSTDISSRNANDNSNRNTNVAGAAAGAISGANADSNSRSTSNAEGGTGVGLGMGVGISDNTNRVRGGDNQVQSSAGVSGVEGGSVSGVAGGTAHGGDADGGSVSGVTGGDSAGGDGGTGGSVGGVTTSTSISNIDNYEPPKIPVNAVFTMPSICTTSTAGSALKISISSSETESMCIRLAAVQTQWAMAAQCGDKCVDTQDNAIMTINMITDELNEQASGDRTFQQSKRWSGLVGILVTIISIL